MAKLVGAVGSDLTRQDVLKVRRRLQVVARGPQAYVAKWPPLRGPGKTLRQQAWVNRFKCLARGLKSPDPITLDAATFWAKFVQIESSAPISNSGWYYRDVLSRAAYGKLLSFQGAKRITTPTVYTRKLVNQSVAGSSFVALTATEELWDNNNFHDNAVNPSRLVFRSPGLYLFGACAVKKTAGTGNQLAAIYKNGSVNMCELKMATAPADQSFPLVSINFFNANDYIELYVFTSSGPLNWQILNFWAVAITPEALL